MSIASGMVSPVISPVEAADKVGCPPLPGEVEREIVELEMATP